MSTRAPALTAALVFAVALAAPSSATAGADARPIGHYLFPSRGLAAQFERRGAPYGYVWGEVIQQLHSFDPLVGSTVEQEVKRQLDQMRAIGVNEIDYQLRTADPIAEPEFKPPDCNQPPVQGLQWPQPTASELANLSDFFDLVHNEGMRVVLELNNTHMEEQPPTNAEHWLGSILNVVKDKPALDLVQFDGTPHLLDTSGSGTYQCGIPSEAPLALGPGSVVAQYVRWAIGYGLSLGLPATKLTAEAQVGWDFWDSHQQTPILPPATDGHWWAPIETMKTIFDQLGVPADDRTYSLSLYEHHRCAPAFSASPNCVDEGPNTWADESLRRVRDLVGPQPRVFAGEFGALPPADPAWPTETAIESLSALMQRYQIDGGDYWQWVDANDAQESDPQSTQPVKRRGVAFLYSPVRLALLDMYGFHLAAIPNGSFEDGGSHWTATGSGSAHAKPLQEDFPWRGASYLDLNATRTYSLTSRPIRVSASTRYTTTANLRFSRPNTRAAFTYLTCRRRPSKAAKATTFLLGPPRTNWQIFPFVYTTPRNVCYVRITFSLAGAGILDVDDVR